jgi:hypothetical protein
MPNTQYDILTAVASTPITNAIPLEKGRLKSACASATNEDTNAINGRVYGLISLHLGVPTQRNMIAALASGYITLHQVIGWTGDIPLGNEFWIRTVVQGDTLLNVRTSVITE